MGVSALKGEEDLRAPEEAHTRVWYPSIVETIPPEYPSLKHEFSKLENQILTRAPRSVPLTPVLPAAHDRIFTGGYHYNQSTPPSTGPTVPRLHASPKQMLSPAPNL